MNPTSLLYILLGIAAVSYVFDQVLDYINLKAQRKDIPEEIASFYNKEKYLRSLDYHQDQTRFSFVTSAFSFVLSFSMLLFGGFGYLDTLLRPYFDNEIFLALGFFGAIVIASDILTMPFQWYSTFVIEERYGFNKTTVKTFVTDKLKGYLLGSIIGGSLLALLIYSINQIGPDFWIWFGLLAAAFILFINMFYTTLLLPLFNKLTPLGDGELKNAIEAFAKKVDFPLDNIFIMD
ncbi:MAG TPA: peptidase M48, partial [Cytophagales bacterium]|nr:peptidase M48 [Cytophagales bacterium]